MANQQVAAYCPSAGQKEAPKIVLTGSVAVKGQVNVWAADDVEFLLYSKFDSLVGAQTHGMRTRYKFG